jgi:hypothetical protein
MTEHDAELWGRLAPDVEAFSRELQRLGFRDVPAQAHQRVFGELGRWLDARAVSLGALTSERLEEFLADRREQGPTWSPGGACARRWTICGLWGLCPLRHDRHPRMARRLWSDATQSGLRIMLRCDGAAIVPERNRWRPACLTTVRGVVG